MQHLNYDTADLFSLNTPKKSQPKSDELYCVYAVTCKATKTTYIGSGKYSGNADDTLNPKKVNRLAYHRSRLKKGDHPSETMQSDYLLFPDSFSFSVLQLCPYSESKQREQLAMIRIKQLGSYQLYNVKAAYHF